MPTVTGQRGDWGVCDPYFITMEHKGSVRSADRPVPTITTAKGGAIGVAQPFLIPQQAGGRPAHSVDEPLATITTTATGVGLAEPFLVKYYGTGVAASTGEPIDTVTSRDRFGLAEPVVLEQIGDVSHLPIVEKDGVRYRLDIRFRMLQPHELASAQGFPRDYQFTGSKTDVVKQIGNAVPCGVARALVRAALQ